MAPPPVTNPVEEMLDTHDIQGLVVRGYGDLKGARFFLLEVTNARAAREYLQQLVARINRADESPNTYAIQIAFTAQGLQRLEMPAHVLATFSREFLEGMDQTDRADALGDRDKNDPSTWEWGHATKPDALLMIYALEDLLEAHVAGERAAFARGFRVAHEKQTVTLDKDREHFGWRDGISMPKIAGVPPDPEKPPGRKREWWTTPMPPGEFVLGYKNDYNAFTESPTVAFVDDPENLLPIAPDGLRKSLGRNGTYLVHREMTQDVHAFWHYLRSRSREEGTDEEARAIALAAKMVGRWPDGAPLMTSKGADDPDRASDNEFMYNADRAGLVCPRGAHIRRANPRDVLAVDERSNEASISMVRKHQMVRRGRAFGRPVVENLDPRAMMKAAPDRERRGLHFMCLVGDINRQFEFVQRAWIHSANFDSMFKDGDVIAAGRRQGPDNPNDEFTCPAEPVRRKYKAIPQFTTLVGGAYFFLPSLTALRFISRHPTPLGDVLPP